MAAMRTAPPVTPLADMLRDPKALERLSPELLAFLLPLRQVFVDEDEPPFSPRPSEPGDLEPEPEPTGKAVVEVDSGDTCQFKLPCQRELEDSTGRSSPHGPVWWPQRPRRLAELFLAGASAPRTEFASRTPRTN